MDTKRVVINVLAAIGGVAIVIAAATGVFVWFINGSGDNELKAEFVSTNG